MTIRADPARTSALVVGVGGYAQASWNVDGPAETAQDVYNYLRTGRGIPSERTRCLISEQNGGGTDAQPTQEAVRNALVDLSKEDGDLLVVFWSGHGAIDTDGRERLFFADAQERDPRNLDLRQVLRAFASDWCLHFRQQLWILDTCAVSMRYTLEFDRVPGLGLTVGNEVNTSQALLFGSLLHQPSRAGKFWKVLRPELKVHEANNRTDDPSQWPELGSLFEALKAGFEAAGENQTPRIELRNWDGSRICSWNPPAGGWLPRIEREETTRSLAPRSAGQSVMHWVTRSPSSGDLPTNLLMRWGLQRGKGLGVTTVPPGISLLASLRSTETVLRAAIEQTEGARVSKRTWLELAGTPRPFKNSRDLYASLEPIDDGEATAFERQETLPGFVVNLRAAELHPEDLDATVEWCASVAALPGHSKAAICIGIKGRHRDASELVVRLAGVLRRDEGCPVDVRISSPDLAVLPKVTELPDDFAQLRQQLEPALKQLMLVPSSDAQDSGWVELPDLVRALDYHDVASGSLQGFLEWVLVNAPAAAAPLVREMARSGNGATRGAAFAHAVGHDRLMDAWLEGIDEDFDHLRSSIDLFPLGKGPSPKAALVCALVRRWCERPTGNLEQTLTELMRNAQPELRRAVTAVMDGDARKVEFYDDDPGSEVLEFLSRCWPQLVPPIDDLSAAIRTRSSMQRFVESLRVTERLLAKLLRLPLSARAAFRLDPSEAVPLTAADRGQRGQDR